MSTLRILLGPSGSGKSTALFKRVIENAEKDPKKNFIVIVPEQVSHAVTEKLIEMSERKGIINIDVLSFARLSHRIFDNAGRDYREIIDDTGKNLILRRVISEKADELKVLKGNIKKPGYINELKSIISEFVQYELCPADIEKIIESSDKKYLSSKLRDILLLFSAFREKTEEQFVTREELLDRAAEAADRAEFLKGAEIYLDDFTGFTPIQYRFLSSIFNHVGDVSLCLDYDGYDGELFALSVSTIEKIRSIAGDAGFKTETIHFYDSEFNRFSGSAELSMLEKRLFRSRDKDIAFEGEPQDLRIVRALNPGEEAEYVVKEVMSLVRMGFRFREIGIVMSSPERYELPLKATASKEELPLFIDSKTEILLNPYTEFIRSALEAVSKNLNYESVFHLIRTGLTPIDREDADLLENYVRALNIRGKKKYKEKFIHHTRSISEEELERINIAREKLMELLEPLIETASGGKKKAGIYTRELRNFMESAGIEDKVLEMSMEFEERKELELSRIYEQIPSKTEELLSKIESLIPDEVMSFTEFTELLDAGFEAIRIGVLPPGIDCLRAGDMERSRYSDIRVLFFMGMNDGLIPAGGGSKGLLSDPEREYIKEMGLELSPTAREKTMQEMLYFYMNVTKPSEKLYLSYASSDGEGGSLNPSFFLDAVREIFPKLNITSFDSAKEAERICTENDLLNAFALYVISGEKDEEAGKLYKVMCGDKKLKEKADRILDALLKIHGEDAITEAVSRALYGDESVISPTRLEKFAACAYSHFMLYGLKAMEREEFGFEKRDLGSVLHNVLNICSRVIKDRGLKYRDLSEEEAENIAVSALEKYLSENDDPALRSSERNKYFINRIKRILTTTVKALKKQSEKGRFEPEAFEKDFRTDGFYGRIDRVDTVRDGNVIYVSVIDYKSGNKDFDLSRVYYALDLQLAVYMDAALEIERIEHPGTDVIPAGIFYYHIDDPSVKEEDLKTLSKEETEGKIMESLKLRGIVNSDRDVIKLFDSEFIDRSTVVPVSFNKDGSFSAHSSVASAGDLKVISDHVQRKALEMRQRIIKGEINPSPAVYDEMSPCRYCDFNDCCRFDKGTPGFSERRFKKIGKKDDIFQKMKDTIGESDGVQ